MRRHERQEGEHGSIQLDFAYDEQLPDPPIFTAVPRGDGGPPTVVWSASRELSQAWKVQWLAADQANDGQVAGKDLYNAVLLAELDGIRLPDRLRRRVLRAVPILTPCGTGPSTGPGLARTLQTNLRTGSTDSRTRYDICTMRSAAAPTAPAP